MDVFEAIAKRYSYRGPFTPDPVPREHLRRIVQAGIQAPSGKNEQTTSFVIVDDSALLRRMAQIIDRPVCQTARAMIVCVTDPRPVFEQFSFHVEDCAAAVENMLLAITALGYASVWLDGVLRLHNVAERIAALLGIPRGRTVRVILPLGVPAQPGTQKEKRPFDARAWFNRWGAAPAPAKGRTRKAVSGTRKKTSPRAAVPGPAGRTRKAVGGTRKVESRRRKAGR